MINIENLDFNYHKVDPLFKQLNLNIHPGSITGLFGKNGTGKTTLLKIITGLLHAHGGNVTVGGFNPKNAAADFLSDILLVSEEFSLPDISIKDHVKANSPFYPNFDIRLFDQMLAEFDLSQIYQLNQLSLGQKKKYLISFAIFIKLPSLNL